MAEQRDDFTWVEQYLAEELSEAEKETFLARLSREPALQRQVQEQSEAILALRILEKGQLRQQLQQDWQALKAREEIPAPRQARVIRMVALGLAAAAAITLLFLFLRPETPSLSTQQLALHYFDPDPTGLVRGPNERDPLLEAAEQAYRNQQYEAAATDFQRYLDQHPQEGRAQLFLALAQLAQENAAATIPMLTKLLNDPLVDERARWNLALAYLMQGDKGAAVTLLTEIQTSTGHYKSVEAKKLLGDL